MERIRSRESGLRPDVVRRLAAAALAGAALASAAHAACPAAYDYAVIASTAEQFAAFDRAPAIGANGEVAFLAEPDSGGGGILAGDGGDPLLHALDQEADPESEIYLFSNSPALGPGRHTAFDAFVDCCGGTAIFRGYPGATPSVVARNRVADPESPYFAFDPIFGPDLTVTEDALFSASLFGTSAESAVVAGTQPSALVHRMASAAIPEYGFVGPVAHWETNDLALFASREDNSLRGVYRERATLAELAVEPIGLGPSEPSITRGGQSSRVAYRRSSLQEGSIPVDFRVERYDESAAVVLVDTADGAFDRVGLGPAGDATVPNVAVAAGGCVVFRGEETAGDDGSFVADEDGVQAVLGTGDVVAGGWVYDAAIGRHAVDDYGRVAIWAHLVDTQTFEDRWLVLRADPQSGVIPLFANGFQSGSTLGWSATVP